VDDQPAPGETLHRADRLDWSSIPSPGRRAARLLDVAEAHQQRAEPTAVVHMIGRAHRESAETVRYSLWARQALLELVGRPGAVRHDARELAAAIGPARVDTSHGDGLSPGSGCSLLTVHVHGVTAG